MDTGSGGSTGLVVLPLDASAGASESGSSADGSGAIPPADGAAIDAGRTGFVHPGILVNRAQLDFVKSKLGVEPWKSGIT